MNDDIPALRRKLQQLSVQHDSGAISADAFATEKALIERQLLDRVLADPTTPASIQRPSKRLVASLAVAVLAVAGAGYWWTGSPGQPSAGVSSAPGMAPDDTQQSENVRLFAQAVEQLAEKLKQNPDNPDGWALLARSYVRLGELEPALTAFKQAVALRGDDAGLLADYADVLAIANGRSLQGEPSALIERALKLEPDHLKALSLAGAAAFDRQDYASAVRNWERVVISSPPGSANVPELQAGIDEARKLGGLVPGSAAAGASQAVSPQSATAPRAASGAPISSAIRGTVRLSPELASKATPTDAVFVYARAAEGPRMPLAIVRLQVKDLPAAFTLDDSLAMSPAAKLSGATTVIVSARVSKSGQAAPSAGDLLGETAPMANRGDGVTLVIDQIVKP